MIVPSGGSALLAGGSQPVGGRRPRPVDGADGGSVTAAADRKVGRLAEHQAVGVRALAVRLGHETFPSVLPMRGYLRPRSSPSSNRDPSPGVRPLNRCAAPLSPGTIPCGWLCSTGGSLGGTSVCRRALGGVGRSSDSGVSAIARRGERLAPTGASGGPRSVRAPTCRPTAGRAGGDRGV